MKDINYWHMQMHPSEQEGEYWEYLEWILEHRKFIGLGKWKEKKSQISDFINKINVNDIIAIKKGGTLIALVQVIGGHYFVPEDSLNNDDRIKWIVNRRPIRVLDWNTSGRTIPQPRGTLNICRREDVETTKIIKGWHDDVVKVMKRRNINLTV